MIRGPLDRLAATASLVFIADFATKQWARHTLADGSDRWLGAGWHLALVNNTHLAGGMQGGGFEVPLTALLTTIVAVLVLRVCSQLTAIDPAAPATLGLVLGSGAANLADALIPPHGVVDFIAFTASAGTTVSFNVADVALAAGLVLCVRTMWGIARRMRTGDQPRLIPHRNFSGALPMRERLVLSGGHALLGMCIFVWLYSMTIAFTRDAGQSAPSSLLCGIGVFALVFVGSQLRFRANDQRFAAQLRDARQSTLVERVVLDGSVAAVPFADRPAQCPRPEPAGDLEPGRHDLHGDLT